MEFTNGSYVNKTFTQIKLVNETIQRVEFEDCTFSECSLVDCKVINCSFVSCTFTGCVLSALLLTDTRFVDIDFKNCKVIGIDWTKAQQVRDVSFHTCQINYDNFRMLKLPKIQIVSCEAKEVDFLEANLTEGLFTDTDFEKSIFSKTNLTKANFIGAKNYYIDTKTNTITKAHFSLPEALSLLMSLDVVID